MYGGKSKFARQSEADARRSWNTTMRALNRGKRRHSSGLGFGFWAFLGMLLAGWLTKPKPTAPPEPVMPDWAARILAEKPEEVKMTATAPELDLNSDTIMFQGIPLFVGFKQGEGLAVNQLPRTPGIYAEVYWPQRGCRIGETERYDGIRGKVGGDDRWFDMMHDGTAPEKDLRRIHIPNPHPIVLAAAATGSVGFEYYVVSDHPRLKDMALRHEAERFLHALELPGLVNWNFQKSWRRT